LYFESIGLAAARMAVLEFNVHIIPDFAIDNVYYSIASCMIVLVDSFIISNSSIQQMPLSLSTSAPDSNIISFVSGSLLTKAVKPTADNPFPEL
jgi:hypothetical protein